MPRGFEAALDDCLSQLTAGADIEECLQRYPSHRAELEPLLQTARAVRSAFVRPAPSERGLERARVRFMAEVDRRQREEAAKASSGWAQRLFGMSSGFATAAITLILVFAVLTGGGIASASSLPGDALYGVKRASESVRLFLALSEDSRARLQSELDAARVDEVREVIEQNRAVDVAFSGVVDDVRGDTVYVDGIAVKLSPETGAGERPAIGAVIQIEARTSTGGVVEAKAFDVLATPEQPATPSPRLRPTFTPLPEPTDKPTETALPSATPSNTALPTFTEAATDTAVAEPSGTSTVTQTASALPSVTNTATSTPSSTATEAPTYTPVPAPRDIEVRIEGSVDAIGSSEWTVAGTRILVDSDTSLNEDVAQAEVGGWVAVDALQKPDGRIVATSIVVLRAAKVDAVPVEFAGTIESASGDVWRIGGRDVTITSDTVVTGQAEVGATARVKAEEYPDGTLLAKSITIEKPAEHHVQIEGIIESISGNVWVVAGQQIVVPGGTPGSVFAPATSATRRSAPTCSAWTAKTSRCSNTSPPGPIPTRTARTGRDGRTTSSAILLHGQWLAGTDRSHGTGREAFEQYLWTGDRSLIDDPEIFAYHTNLHTEFMKHQDVNGNGIADETFNWPRSGKTTRTISSRPATPSAASTRALLAYAGGPGGSRSRRRCRPLARRGGKAPRQVPCRVVQPGDATVSGGASIAMGTRRTIGDTRAASSCHEADHRSGAADRRLISISSFNRSTPRELNIEAKTYLPEVFYKHGRNAMGWHFLKQVMRSRNIYPEVAFTCISNTVCGLMGPGGGCLRTAALQRSPRLTDDVPWVECDRIPVGGNLLRLRHDGERRTTLTNLRGDPLTWEARFYGRHPRFSIDGKPHPATADWLNGMPISTVEIRVIAGQTVRVEIPGDPAVIALQKLPKSGSAGDVGIGTLPGSSQIVMVGGKYCPRAICLRGTDAFVEYDLPERCRRLTAEVGVDDSHEGAVELVVEADDAEVFRSGPLSREDGLRPVDLPFDRMPHAETFRRIERRRGHRGVGEPLGALRRPYGRGDRRLRRDGYSAPCRRWKKTRTGSHCPPCPPVTRSASSAPVIRRW